MLTVLKSVDQELLKSRDRVGERRSRPFANAQDMACRTDVCVSVRAS